MIKGVLMINMNPPYAGFSTAEKSSWRHCSKDELLELLVAMNAVDSDHQLPLECQFRLTGEFPVAQLVQFGLLERGAVKGN